MSNNSCNFATENDKSFVVIINQYINIKKHQKK